jgi:hypothetical protein
MDLRVKKNCVFQMHYVQCTVCTGVHSLLRCTVLTYTSKGTASQTKDFKF